MANRGDATVVSSDVRFRHIQREDLEVLARFMADNDVPAVVRTFNPFPMTVQTAHEIASQQRLDHFYGAFLEDGSIVGLSMLRGWDEGYTVPSFGIMIDHRFHGRGIGSLMLDYTLEQAIQLGCNRIRLSVFASNRAGLHLYSSRGFVEDSRQAVNLSDDPDERIIMFKELSPPSA
jgi:ribosomal protein S18 acetylase RimI-like enzyme